MIAQQEKQVEKELGVLNSFKKSPKRNKNKFGKNLLKSIANPFVRLQVAVLAQQEKQAEKELAVLDFFKTKKSAKEKKEKLVKDVFKYIVNPLFYLQLVSLIAFTSTMATHYHHIKVESLQVFSQYEAYQENIKNKNYKEATYSLNNLLTSQTSLGNTLGLLMVNKSVFFPDSTLPESFVKESINLADRYHNAGNNAEIEKDEEFKPCATYDPGCRLMFSVIKNSLDTFNKYRTEQINESYYNLTHIPEYKKYYKIPVEQRITTPSPYQLSKNLK